jgi:hypothetical protein
MFKSNASLLELLEIRSKMILENKNTEKIDSVILEKEQEYIDYLNEDTSGTGGPAGAVGGSSVGSSGVALSNATTAGMGAVVSPQPSMFAGVTTEPGYSMSGGTIGSGDISVPYNPGGRKKVFQKVPAPLTDRKGSNKRRKNKILRGLKDIFSMKQDYTAKQGGVKKSNIMNFDNFSKEELNKVTKVKQ